MQQEWNDCRPVLYASRMSPVRNKTDRSAKSREASRRTRKGYRFLFKQLRGPAQVSRTLLLGVAVQTNVNES